MPWANSTSIRASVRTFAAAVKAKARNKDSDVTALRHPVKIDGLHSRKIASMVPGDRKISQVDSTTVCIRTDAASVRLAAVTNPTAVTLRMAPR